MKRKITPELSSKDWKEFCSRFHFDNDKMCIRDRPMSPSMATTININNANSFVFILRPIFLTGLFLVLAANMIPPIYSGISLY